MLKLKKIAITGSLCSGKTTVTQIFKEKGAYIISADEIAHQLLSNNKECIKKVSEALDLQFLDKQIDRVEIAKIVFSNPQKLEALEKILHPKIFHEIQKEYEKSKTQNNYTYFVAEVPLLYEVNWEGFFDVVILVKADKEIRMKRFKKNELEFFDERERRKSAIKNAKTAADFIIQNNSTEEALKNQVLTILHTLDAKNE